MRLIRFRSKGNAKPGLVRGDKIVDLTTIFPEIPDIGEKFFRDDWLLRVSEVNDPGRKIDVRLDCPIVRPSKLICLGINYIDHQDESGIEKPEKPLLFCKTPNALCGPHDSIVLPRSSKQVDWEVELAVIIGQEGKRIPKNRAFDYIAGFCVMNDVSARDAQFGDAQWFRGKSFDTFAPLGPALTTLDELDDIHNLTLSARVNGKIMQKANTRDMIFDIPTIVEYVSEDITLIPGDIISTGTPSGVGIFRHPTIVLQGGDVVECRVEGIGSIVNKVADG